MIGFESEQFSTSKQETDNTWGQIQTHTWGYFFILYKIQKSQFKDVRAKNFYNTDFFHTLTTVRQWVTYVRNGKKIGHRLRFLNKARQKLPQFDKLAFVTRHGLSAC